MDSWIGLTREQVAEFGNAYEAACLVAADRAVQNHPDDRGAAALQLIEMRKGIRLALCNELRSIGCPESEIAETLALIINRQVKHRMATARAEDATGGSETLH